MEITINMNPNRRCKPSSHLDSHTSINPGMQRHIIRSDTPQQRSPLSCRQWSFCRHNITPNVGRILRPLKPPWNRSFSNTSSLVLSLNVHPPVVNSNLLVRILSMESEDNVSIDRGRVRGCDIHPVDNHILDIVLWDLGLENEPDYEGCQAENEDQED